MLKSALIIALLMISRGVFAQGIAVPQWGDRYSELVKKAESGDTNINFQQLRDSFLVSRQFKVAGAKSRVMDSLTTEMYAAMRKTAYNDVLEVTQKMLSIDYTCMLAHKVLQQTYGLMGDDANHYKYHAVEFGLLNSIVNHGDGQTCETGWPVIQVSEEYFIMSMLDVTVKQQHIVTKAGFCDEIVAATDDGDKTYYFDISRIPKGNKTLGIQ
jgi:hypothetical protein